MATAMRELRTAVMIVVEVSWQDAGGNWQKLSGRMEDKSASGASIRVKTEIALGTRLRIQWRFEQFSGICKYCRRDEAEYVVGLLKDAPGTASIWPNGSALAPQVQMQSGRTSAESLPEKHVNPPISPPPQDFKKEDLKSENRKSHDLKSHDLKTHDLKTHDLKSPDLKNEDPKNTHLRKPESIHRDAKHADAKREQRAEVRKQRPPDEKPTELRSSASAAVRPFPRSASGIHGHRREDHPRLYRREAFAAVPQAAVLTTRPESPPTERMRSVKGEETRKETKSMARKWFELSPWKSKEQVPAKKANPEPEPPGGAPPAFIEGVFIPPAERISMDHADKVTAHSEVELLPMEDIYRAAGIMSPRKGYSVSKVIEMLNSEYIRGSSPEMKRAALLVALEAANTSLDQVQQDAKLRQGALDTYEAAQTKQVEDEWQRKTEENNQIEEELERIKQHYAARISRNLESLERDKSRFGDWLASKRQESESISEAVELCLRPSHRANAPLANAAAAGAAGGSQVLPGLKDNGVRNGTS